MAPNKTDEEIESLIKDNTPLLKWIIGHRYQRFAYNEEFYAAGQAALGYAAQKYDPTHSKKASFGTYASICILRALFYEYMRLDRLAKHATLHDEIDEFNTPTTTTTPFDLLLADERAEIALRVVREEVSKLPEKHRIAVKQCYGIGCEKRIMKVVGETLGLSGSRVGQLLDEAAYAIRRHMKKGGEMKITTYTSMKRRIA